MHTQYSCQRLTFDHRVGSWRSEDAELKTLADAKTKHRAQDGPSLEGAAQDHAQRTWKRSVSASGQGG